MSKNSTKTSNSNPIVPKNSSEKKNTEKINCHIPVLISEIGDFVMDKKIENHQKFSKKLWQKTYPNGKMIENPKFKTKKQRKKNQEIQNQEIQNQQNETKNGENSDLLKNEKTKNLEKVENFDLLTKKSEKKAVKKAVKIFDGTLGGFGYFDFLANLYQENETNLEYFGCDLDESVILQTEQKKLEIQQKLKLIKNRTFAKNETLEESNLAKIDLEKNSEILDLEKKAEIETEIKTEIKNEKINSKNEQKILEITQKNSNESNIQKTNLEAFGKTEKAENCKAESEAKENLLEINLTNTSSVEINLQTKQANFVDFIEDFEDSFFDAIILDLGFSGNQLTMGWRGFSYQKMDELLDLRYDQNTKIPCFKKLSQIKISSELGNLLYRFSGEKLSQKIAANIFTFLENLKIETKQKSPEITVEQMTDVILASIPAIFRRKSNQILSRIWQALRIWTNDELSVLEEFLPKAVAKLKPHGKLMIVSFHSLEDKIVTSFMRDISAPISDEYGNKFQNFKLLTSRAVVAGSLELEQNSQSRSAMLRVLERVSLD